MKLPADVRFVGLEASDALAAAAREKAAKLDLFCPSIMACRVTVEQAHKHHHQGRMQGQQKHHETRASVANTGETGGEP